MTDPQPDPFAAPAGYMWILPKVCVPTARAMEWFVGMRPLPDMDEDESRYYFDSQVEHGLLTRVQAAQLAERHDCLTRQERSPIRGISAELAAELVRQGWTPPSARHHGRIEEVRESSDAA